jgi:hypothetical protein
MIWAEETKVYPSTTTQNMALPLRFADKETKDVWFTTLKMMNVGSEYVGEQNQTWPLDLCYPKAEIFSLIGTPTAIPRSTVLSVGENRAPNTVSLTLGVLEPRSQIVLHGIIINAESTLLDTSLTQRDRLRVGCPGSPGPSLPGLPRVIAGGKLWAQFAERFLPLTIAGTIIWLVYLGYRNYGELSHFKVWWSKGLVVFAWVLIGIVGGAVIAAIGAIFLSLIASGIFLAGPFFETIVRWFS